MVRFQTDVQSIGLLLLGSCEGVFCISWMRVVGCAMCCFLGYFFGYFLAYSARIQGIKGVLGVLVGLRVVGGRVFFVVGLFKSLLAGGLLRLRRLLSVLF